MYLDIFNHDNLKAFYYILIEKSIKWFILTIIGEILRKLLYFEG